MQLPAGHRCRFDQSEGRALRQPTAALVAKREPPTECFHPDPAHPEWAVWQPEQIWSGVAQSLRGRGGGRRRRGDPAAWR